ncbi:MAG: RING finger domain-containing protein, partial [Candidatus Kariarchaeaceae archaeon]
DCGVIAPKCVICFDDPEPNEQIILFDCCKSYAHRDHAYTWISKENICPSCRAREPQLKPIEEEIQK